MTEDSLQPSAVSGQLSAAARKFGRVYYPQSISLEGDVDAIELLGTTMGLGFAAGIRLYATVLVLGLAIRFGWFHLGAAGQPLGILANPIVLVIAGVACAIEFVADKIPWVDSIWDGFHAFIRTIGAVVLAAAAFGSFDPALKVSLILLCGGVAFASHSTKAATRLVVNHSPEPFSNIGLSLIEDALVPFGIWLSLRHPQIVFCLVLAFLIGFLWLAPKVFRAVRLQFVALRLWLGGNRDLPGAQPPPPLKPGLDRAFGVVARHACPIPSADAKPIQRALGLEAPASGIRAAATKNIEGLGNSVGYLVIAEDGIAFATRRGFRHRVHRIPFAEVERAEWKRGLLMNRLVIRTAKGENAFYVFKDVEIPRIPPFAESAKDGAPTFQQL
jgi:hypothetical protein